MQTTPSTSPAKSEPALPVPRVIEYPWMSVAAWQTRYRAHVEQAAKGGVDLLLVGDSITEGWGGTQAWTRSFGTYASANFGIGGDATQNLLWRLENGCVGALRPKVVVLLIGVNNLGREQHSPEETTRGVRAVLDFVRRAFPAAKVLLYGIFPADASPDTAFRRAILETNRHLAGLGNGETVFFEDIGDRFLEADGRLSPEVSPDALHLSEEGYRRWAEAMAPRVKALMAG